MCVRAIYPVDTPMALALALANWYTSKSAKAHRVQMSCVRVESAGEFKVVRVATVGASCCPLHSNYKTESESTEILMVDFRCIFHAKQR